MTVPGPAARGLKVDRWWALLTMSPVYFGIHCQESIPSDDTAVSSLYVKNMRDLIKKSIMDSRVEPYVRWLVKRLRGIRMPFDLVKNEIYDRQAFEVIKRVLHRSSNCVDVGCHEGAFLYQIRKYAPLGRHFAFEPIPHLAEQLAVKFPTLEISSCALSNVSGESVFYIIPDAPALSGLSEREFLNPEKARDVISVRTQRLDSLIPEDIKIDLIKIDVEGAEGLVILGALEIIKRDKPYIIFEHGNTSSMAFGISSSDIYELLVNCCHLKLSTPRGWLYREPPLSKERFGKSGEWSFLAFLEAA